MDHLHSYARMDRKMEKEKLSDVAQSSLKGIANTVCITLTLYRMNFVEHRISLSRPCLILGERRF